MMLRRIALILTAGMVLVALQTGLAAQSGSFHRQYQVSGPVTLIVHNGSGDVHVSALPGHTVTIDAVIRSHFNLFFGASPQDIQRIEQNPPITQSGNSIRIDQVRAGWMSNISIRYTITTPPDTEVRAETGSGDLYLASLQRAARLGTGSGDIHLDNLGGGVHASTGSGDITFGRIQGDAELSTGSGDIRGREVTGHSHVSTGSGDVRIEQMDQGGYAGTGSGQLSVGQVTGDLTAHSGSGDLTIQGQLDGEHHWDLRTGSGELHLALAGGSAAQAQLSTDSGDITVRLPSRNVSTSRHSWTGVIGNGSAAATLNAHAGSGDIVVH